MKLIGRQISTEIQWVRNWLSGNTTQYQTLIDFCVKDVTNLKLLALYNGIQYNCRTPYGTCEKLYMYLTMNGIDVDVVCDGEVDGKYIFKSRGGEYTEHYTASGGLCY